MLFCFRGVIPFSFKSLLIVDVTGVELSVFSISRRLKSEGYKARVAEAKDFLTDDHKRGRADFAGAYGGYDDGYWAGVAYCDEKTFGYDEKQKPWICIVYFY